MVPLVVIEVVVTAVGLCGACMSVIGSLKNMLDAMYRALGLASQRAADVEQKVASPAIEAPMAITVPAVAGFVWRLAVDRFLLARRLASIARLNTPAGRKPYGALKRSAGLPPIPAARLGAKKTRLNANQGPRVLKQAPAMQQRSATIIPFPARNATGRHAGRLARAA